MSVPLWVSEAAAAFWDDVGEAEPYPRNLRRPIARALPLTLVFLPQLSVAAAEAWLRRQTAFTFENLPDRSLRACLICRFGHGIIFIDGADAEDEQRFSLAHELSHFLRDYHHPRHRAARLVGTEVLQVLDCYRPARAEERIVGVLSKVEVQPYVHLMDRTGREQRVIEAAEAAADRLAFELLAPWESVRNVIDGGTEPANSVDVMGLLMARFGLPADAARRYRQVLELPDAGTSSLLQHLRRNYPGVELRGSPAE